MPLASVLQLHLPAGWPAAGAVEPQFRYVRRVGSDCDAGLARLSDIAPANTVITVVPASAVHFVRVTLPDLRPARIARLLPLAVEGHLAAAPEEIHAVLVDHVPGGESLVLVCDKAWLGAALDALAARGLRPARVIAETELAARLPAFASMRTWIVVRSAAGGFARLGAGEIIALDLGAHDADVPLALRLARGTHRRGGEAPAEIVVFSAPDLGSPDLDLWSRVLHLPVRSGGDWRPELMDARGLRTTDLLRGLADRGAPIGLSRPVRLAGVTAAGILVLHLLLTVGQGWRLSAERHALDAGMEKQFRAIFPDAQVVVDAPLQMRRGLARLRQAAGVPDAADLAPLLAAVAPAVTAIGARTERLRYERGALELKVILPAGATHSALEQQLVVPGYRVRVERSADPSSADALTLSVQAEG